MRLLNPILHPPVFDDPDKSRAAVILHFILVATIGIAVIVMVVVMVFVPTPDIIILMVTLVAQIFMLVLLRRGQVRLTGVILCCVAWLAVAVKVYDRMGALNPLIGAEALVIMMMGLLVNLRAALVMMGLSILYAVWLAFSVHDGLFLAESVDLTIQRALINEIGIFVLTGVFLYSVIRALEDARKRAGENERALRKSEERYRSLVQNGPNLIYVVNPDHDIKFVSYGVNNGAEKVEGRSIYDFVLNDCTPSFRRALDHAFRTRDPDRLEIQGRNPHGQIFWFLSYLAPIVEDGQAVEVAVIMTDISVRKRMEMEQRAAAEQYRKLFEGSPYPMFVMDWETQKIIEVNDAMIAHYDFSHDELIGMSVVDIKAEQDRPAFLERMEKFKTEDTRFNGGIVSRQVKKDGSIVWVEAAFHRLKFRGRDAALVINYDLTDRMNAEKSNLEAERLRLDLAKERDILAMKEHFIAMMSHEFRTPLAVILSSKETLEHYFDRITAERRLEKLQQIGAQVSYVIRLLDDVLLMGQAQAGKLKFNPVPLNLEEFCRKLFEELQVTDRQTHTFVFQAQDAVGMVNADQQLLQHIIVNLVMNAVKYSPSQGEVRLEIGLEGGEVYIRVSDQGIGIPEEQQAHLFEPFYRADNVKGYQGTGLGLAIVKESVTVHGGSVSCKSATGLGTTFTVKLPLDAVIN